MSEFSKITNFMEKLKVILMVGMTVISNLEFINKDHLKNKLIQ